MSFLIENAPALASGVLVTIAVAASGIALGLALAIGFAGASLVAGPLGQRALRIYVNVFRDTPFVVQLFFVFFGLPSLGIQLPAFPAAMVAVTLNFAAYASEMIRAGLEAIPKGQVEAGRALGLHGAKVFLLLQLPQALATSYAALCSQAVLSLLDTAVVSQIALRDLAFQGNLIQSRTFLPFQTYIAVTAIYLCLTLLLRRLLDLLSRRMRRRIAS